MKVVRSADLFSLPFRFSVGGENDKEKKTIFGGLVSISVIVLSVAYFAYLIYLYSANKIQPNIGSTETYARSPFTY